MRDPSSKAVLVRCTKWYYTVKPLIARRGYSSGVFPGAAHHGWCSSQTALVIGIVVRLSKSRNTKIPAA